MLVKIFAHIFCLKYFYVALDGGKVAAMVSCTQGYPPISLKREEFIKILGVLRGNLMYFTLKRNMRRNSSHFAFKDTGIIEFVTTEESSRNKGLGYQLLTYVMEQTPYDAYVLEVADTNKSAIRLYEKLGFREIKRVKANKNSGANDFIYMRRA
ncbi:MAG: GNAT family N-acetyltransferase [Defluviitaleaceae bacterium]|nr:GNAT family N-acetyltransferase [Defluviitaleaceae bacterium]